MNNCSCAWCMGFEPWRSDFCECFHERWRKTFKAIRLGLACEVAWVDNVPFMVTDL